jgi:hypothetical protein
MFHQLLVDGWVQEGHAYAEDLVVTLYWSLNR